MSNLFYYEANVRVSSFNKKKRRLIKEDKTFPLIYSTRKIWEISEFGYSKYNNTNSEYTEDKVIMMIVLLE